MERFFRSFKTEWMPKIGYGSFTDAKYSVSGYINEYYNNVRPYCYNAGLASNESEVRYKDSKTVTKFYYPLHLFIMNYRVEIHMIPFTESHS